MYAEPPAPAAGGSAAWRFGQVRRKRRRVRACVMQPTVAHPLPSRALLTPSPRDCPRAPHARTPTVQCFGEKGESDVKLTEADVLSAVRFDDTGDYLATGDRGGRIVGFERAGGGKSAAARRRAGVSAGSDASLGGSQQGLDAAAEDRLTGPGSSEYRFYTEFQSHDAEFDYLKSLEIEERICQIAWCRRSGPSLMLLSTNEKTIKLWKIAEKTSRSVANFNVTTGPYGGHSPVLSLRMPTLSPAAPTIVTTPRRVYATAHAYHINSIAVNSDGQTFLSADDLRIHLWHLDNPSLSFNVVDIKPSTLEELTEVITGACAHARCVPPTRPCTGAFPRCPLADRCLLPAWITRSQCIPRTAAAAKCRPPAQLAPVPPPPPHLALTSTPPTGPPWTRPGQPTVLSQVFRHG